MNNVKIILMEGIGKRKNLDALPKKAEPKRYFHNEFALKI